MIPQERRHVITRRKVGIARREHKGNHNGTNRKKSVECQHRTSENQWQCHNETVEGTHSDNQSGTTRVSEVDRTVRRERDRKSDTLILKKEDTVRFERMPVRTCQSTSKEGAERGLLEKARASGELIGLARYLARVG